MKIKLTLISIFVIALALILLYKSEYDSGVDLGSETVDLGSEIKESNCTLDTPIIDLRPTKDLPIDFIYAPEIQSFAYESSHPDMRETVIVDGVESPEFENTQLKWSGKYSSDGKSYAYIIEAPRSHAGDRVENIGDGWTLLSDENWQPSKYYIIKDGKSIGPFSDILDIQYSPDGSSFAYSAKRGSKFFVVKDDVQIGEYDIRTPLRFVDAEKSLLLDEVIDLNQFQNVEFETFNKDMTQFAFKVRKIGQIITYMIIYGSGKLQELDGKYNNVYGGEFSPQGDKFSYFGNRAELSESVISKQKAYFIYDGVEYGPYDGIRTIQATFSPDGKSFAYGAERGDQVFVVRDGKELSSYQDISQIVYSDDGESLAYVADLFSGGKVVVQDEIIKSKEYYDIWFSYFPNKETMSLEVTDWKYNSQLLINGKEYEGSALQYSQDGKYYSYRFEKEGKRTIIINRKTFGNYDFIYSLEYSPDGKSNYMIAEKGGKKFFILNGVEIATFDDIQSHQYTKNNKYIVFGAKKGDQNFFVSISRENEDCHSQDQP